MARGLSELQKAILRLAYRNRQEREQKMADLDPHSHEYKVLDHGVGSYDLYHAEVLHEQFGWPIRPTSSWHPEEGERPVGYWRDFSMREIGEASYRKTQASLSRAVSRLKRRGLVERGRASGWTGDGYAVLNLTDEGVRVAERLSVNTPHAAP
jgi:hypothetical protein